MREFACPYGGGLSACGSLRQIKSRRWRYGKLQAVTSPGKCGMSYSHMRRALLLPLLLFLPAACTTAPPSSQADCPQSRSTPTAPAEFLALQNPQAQQGLDTNRARRIFESGSGDSGCVFCHGKTGAGDGVLAGKYSVPPRNFSCAATMQALPDGQLFWAIREGVAGTAMPAHAQLSDEELWLLVGYVRSLAK
ncbi:MAG: cytochrome c [Pedobacter sp.]|nr:cytochrome c [Pedobacter sp.]